MIHENILFFQSYSYAVLRLKLYQHSIQIINTSQTVINSRNYFFNIKTAVTFETLRVLNVGETFLGSHSAVYVKREF
jgi:hypothetical protein